MGNGLRCCQQAEVETAHADADMERNADGDRDFNYAWPVVHVEHACLYTHV